MPERSEPRTELNILDLFFLIMLCVVLPMSLMVARYATMGTSTPEGCYINCVSVRSAFAHRVEGFWLWVCIGALLAAIVLLKAVRLLWHTMWRRRAPARAAADAGEDAGEDAQKDPKPVSPVGWVAIALPAVCLVALAGVGGAYLLHRFDGGSGSGPITGAALDELQPEGDWIGPGGAQIVLTADGKISFTGFPTDMFDGSTDPWPGSDGTGTWAIGSADGSTQQGILLSAYAYGSAAPDQMLLVPVGSPSSPQLDCDYSPSSTGDCVFNRD